MNWIKQNWLLVLISSVAVAVGIGLNYAIANWKAKNTTINP